MQSPPVPRPAGISTALRQSRDQSIAERQELRDEQQAIAEMIHELAVAVERLREQTGGLETSINGRLTQLIERSAAVARIEGRDEERAHPGGE